MSAFPRLWLWGKLVTATVCALDVKILVGHRSHVSLVAPALFAIVAASIVGHIAWQMFHKPPKEEPEQ